MSYKFRYTSGNAMTEYKDDERAIVCPSCGDRRYTEGRYCKGCDSLTDYITCKECGDKSVDCNICDDCGWVWFD